MFKNMLILIALCAAIACCQLLPHYSDQLPKIELSAR